MAERSDLAAEMAALLEDHAAFIRRDAIERSRLQKIIFSRQVSDGQFQFEAVIDETASADEMYKMAQRAMQASDQLLAKAIIADRYDRIDKKINEIEVARKQMARDEVAIDAENAAASIGKRVRAIRTSQQEATLRNQKNSIDAEIAIIEKHKREIEEARRVVAGEDWADVRAELTDEKLSDALRGSRSAAAA